MKNKGFTLVELIVVVAILSIIMLIGVPAFASIVERIQVRSDKASANEIGEALTVREVDVPREMQIEYYPVVKRYDEIERIEDYVSPDHRPQSMKDGYYFVTALQVGGAKKILVGIGKEEMPVTNTAYNSPRASGWAYIQAGKISDFLASNGSMLNETVDMPENYETVVNGEESKQDKENQDEVISKLAVGDIVEYQPTVGSFSVTSGDSTSTFYPVNTKRWQVFSTSGDRISLISEGSVGTLTLNGVEGYRNAVQVLNEIASKYVDNKFVVSGRALGSSGSSVSSIPLSDITYAKAEKSIPYLDDTYSSDKSIIEKNTSLQISSNVWLASRRVSLLSGYTYFAVRILQSDGSDTSHNLYSVKENESGESLGDEACGVRPIIYLSSDVKLTEKSTGVYTLSK